MKQKDPQYSEKIRDIIKRYDNLEMISDEELSMVIQFFNHLLYHLDVLKFPEYSLVKVDVWKRLESFESKKILRKTSKERIGG